MNNILVISGHRAEKSSSIKSIECDLKSGQLDVRQLNGFVKRSLSQLLQISFQILGTTHKNSSMFQSTLSLNSMILL